MASGNQKQCVVELSEMDRDGYTDSTGHDVPGLEQYPAVSLLRHISAGRVGNTKAY